MVRRKPPSLQNDLEAFFCGFLEESNLNGCAGILEALARMQKEKREKHIIDGKAISYKEMSKMGYSKYKCGKVPKQEFSLYQQLIGYDFATDCIDVAQIYRGGKSRKAETGEENSNENVKQHFYRIGNTEEHIKRRLFKNRRCFFMKFKGG